MGATLTALGDWRGKVNVTMQRALGVSIDVMGRTGEEACKHALILMAQSAAVITPKAKAKRPVVANDKFRHLLRKNENGSTYKEARQAGRQMEDYFQFTASREPTAYKPLFGNKKSDISTISPKRRGLAKRSWMWGLGQLGAAEGRPIDGAWRAFTVITGGKEAGYGKVNMMKYITKILPASWANEVSARAANKIMGQAAQRIKRQFKSAVESGNASQAAAIAPYFKAVT